MARLQDIASGKKVLFVSSYVEQETFNALFQHAAFPPSQAGQKYHRLLAEGLRNNGVSVTALSMPPVSGVTSSRRLVWLKKSEKDGVRFVYLPVFCIPVLKQAIAVVGSFFYTLFHLDRETVVLCNGLTLSVSQGARAAARLRGRPCAAFVTDVPEVLGQGRAMAEATRQLARYDGYVLLTARMNERVNPRKKPFLIVEGQVDEGMGRTQNTLSGKYPEKVCLYAGMLYRLYGVDKLVRAFLRVTDPEARLFLYGTGDAEEDIRAAMARDNRIRLMGLAGNETVVAAEVRSTLLINPRPTEGAYAAYSFPSKNLEYMASGTPVLTTCLAGIPEEYEAYTYLFRDESEEGMARTLSQVLSLSRETLHEKGEAAKAFVLGEKTNTRQAGRILAFMKGLDVHGK